MEDASYSQVVPAKNYFACTSAIYGADTLGMPDMEDIDRLDDAFWEELHAAVGGVSSDMANDMPSDVPSDVPVRKRERPRKGKNQGSSVAITNVFKQQRPPLLLPVAKATLPCLESDTVSSVSKLMQLFDPPVQKDALPSANIDLQCYEPPLVKCVRFIGLSSSPPEFKSGVPRRVPVSWQMCKHVHLLKGVFEFFPRCIDLEVTVMDVSKHIVWKAGFV